MTRSVRPSHSVALLPVPHPGPDQSGKVFGSPAMKAALSGGRGWLPLARSLCRGLAGKTGTVFGAEAAERAQCVPSVSQPGRRAAGAAEESSPEQPQEGPAARGKVVKWIS